LEQGSYNPDALPARQLHGDRDDVDPVDQIKSIYFGNDRLGNKNTG